MLLFKNQLLRKQIFGSLDFFLQIWMAGLRISVYGNCLKKIQVNDMKKNLIRSSKDWWQSCLHSSLKGNRVAKKCEQSIDSLCRNHGVSFSTQILAYLAFNLHFYLFLEIRDVGKKIAQQNLTWSSSKNQEQEQIEKVETVQIGISEWF